MTNRVRSLALAAVLGVVGTVLATPVQEPPDSQVNSVSGAVETADSPWSGTNYRIRHVINTGGGHLKITMLTSDSANNLGGRLVINSASGDSWVAWWRDTTIDQVLVRKRNNATGAWTAERAQSGSSEGSRHPSVAFDGTKAWIGYEADATGGGTKIEAKVIEDDPAPFLTATVLATTTYTGTIDSLVQAEAGRLWMSWVDSATQVGWCQYNATTAMWSAPTFESYASDSVPEARDRIRATVLAN